MSNYTVAIKNSAKVDLRKIKQTNLTELGRSRPSSIGG